MKKPKAKPPVRKPTEAEREKSLRKVVVATSEEGSEGEDADEDSSSDEQQEPPLLLTKEQAARALGVCKRTIDYLLAQNALEKVKIRTAVRVTRRSVLALAGQRTPEAAE